MIVELLKEPTTAVLGIGGGLTGLIYFIRFARRSYFSEKKENAVDLASQSVFENLRLENQRMGSQMTIMSNQLTDLYKENRELNYRVAELTRSVHQLVALEKENIQLRLDLIKKENTIEELTKTLNEALKAVRLRTNDRTE